MKRLGIIFLLAALLAIPVSAANRPELTDTHRGDGTITLTNSHSGETETIQYRNDYTYLSEGLEQVSHLLRCRLSQEEAPISPSLVELIDHIQEHFVDQPVWVISGYRSPQLNAQLRRQGHRVARHSLHMEGKAADVRIPRVTARELRDYAWGLQLGGVGYYRGKGFVHVDVGPIRRW